MSGAQKSSKGSIVGCLVIPLVVAFMLGAPFAAFLLFTDGGGGIAWPYLGLGFAFFALAFLGGLRSGEVVSRHGSVKKKDSPVAYYIGLVLFGICALAMYIGYVISLFS